MEHSSSITSSKLEYVTTVTKIWVFSKHCGNINFILGLQQYIQWTDKRVRIWLIPICGGFKAWFKVFWHSFHWEVRPMSTYLESKQACDSFNQMNMVEICYVTSKAGSQKVMQIPSGPLRRLSLGKPVPCKKSGYSKTIMQERPDVGPSGDNPRRGPSWHSASRANNPSEPSQMSSPVSLQVTTAPINIWWQMYEMRIALLTPFWISDP